MQKLEKKSFRRQAADVLRNEICKGRISPGSKIIESKIAVSLGISRTPLREALIQLEREGFLIDKTNHGFRVSSFFQREAIDLYSMLGALEALAVNQIERMDAEIARKLREINEKFAAVKSNPRKLIQIDGLWHETLLSTSENQTVLPVMATLRHRVQRYEFVFMANINNVSGSAKEHALILDLILNRKQKKAAQVVQEQWRNSLNILKPLIPSNS
jgi:DNA-binding GntR family transcriptional regulator